MPQRRLLVVLVAVASVGAAGCASYQDRPPDESGHTRAPRSESLYEQYRRVSKIACTPRRRRDAVTTGVSPLCAPFDAIPAVSQPRFTAAGRARLPSAEPVVAIELGAGARAYPVRYLLFHEVVNDTVAGTPIVVSYCPLCNSAAAHSRRVGNQVLTFGVSGRLSNANLIMFDRQTLSMWQQMTGAAIGGDLEGRRLEPIPAALVAFRSWRDAHPGGQVMLAPQARGPYGRDPYSGYDVDPSGQSPVLEAQGIESDPRLPPKWRIVGVALGNDAVAFPMPRTRSRVAVKTARVSGLPLVAFYRFGTAEAGRTYRLADAPRGWSATVWIARARGHELRLVARKGRFLERTTGSVFDFYGRAVSGPLAGQRLRPVPQVTSFWFAWVSFHPRTKIGGP